MCSGSPVVMTRSSILPSMQLETALKRKAFPDREWKLCSECQGRLVDEAWGGRMARQFGEMQSLAFDSKSPWIARCAAQMLQQ